MLWKIVVVVPLGASPFAVFLFEVILNACATFNHANIALPAWLDGSLRIFIVTPDMHRVHHSVLGTEHDRNYGFNLSLWDRLFRTYLAEPSAGQQGMTIGLNALSERGADAVRLEPVAAVRAATARGQGRGRRRLEEIHGEVAQEQPFEAARGMHLLEPVIEDVHQLAVALLHGDADALPEDI